MRMKRCTGLLAALVVAATGAARAAEPAPLPKVAATVNGKPVPTERLVRILIAGYGKNVLNQLIGLELVQQEAARKGIGVTEKDVAAEMQRTAQGLGFPGTLAELKKLLAQYSREKGFSWAELELSARRNAYLRKIVEPGFAVPDALLRAEYGRRYTSKVEVRMIRTRSQLFALLARQRVLNGESFERIAKEISIDASAAEGGKLPPVERGKHTGDMKIFEETAFSLKAPGELSHPFGAGGSFYVLQLVRRIVPEGKRFGDVRAELEKALYPRALIRQMGMYMRDLFKLHSKIEIHISALAEEPAAPHSRPSGAPAPEPAGPKDDE